MAEALVLETAHDAAFPRLLERRAKGLAGVAAEQLREIARRLHGIAGRLDGCRVIDNHVAEHK